MKSITEVTDNLKGAVDRYDDLPLDDVRELAEVLKILGVNLSYLVFVRDEYYKTFQSHIFNSTATSAAAKKSEAEFKVPELDLCRKLLKHFGEAQTDIRSQISLRKSFD